MKLGFSTANSRFFSRTYLLCIYPVLLALSVLIGPFGALDETEHFLRATAIANGQFIPIAFPPSSTRSRGIAGGFVDQQAAAIAREDDYKQSSRAGTDPTFRFKLDMIDTAMKRVADHRLVFSEHNNTALYPPILYVGSFVGNYVGQATNSPVLLWLYFGRIINAAIAGIVAYFVIKLTPDKSAFLLVASSLPLVVFQSATLSADALLFTCFFAFMSLMYGLATKPQQTWPEMALTGLSACAISVGKVAYAPLAALPLVFAIIHDRRFSRQVMFYLFVMIVSAVLWFIWTMEIHDKVFSMRPGVSINPEAQILWIKNNPLSFIRVIITTFNFHSNNIILDMVGYSLGYSTILINRVFCMTLFLSVFISAMINVEKRPTASLSHYYFLSTLIMSLLSILATILSLYTQFNSVSHPYVEGIQGRYILPLILLCLVIIPVNDIYKWFSNNWAALLMKLCFIGISVAGTLLTLRGVIARYWLSTL